MKERKLGRIVHILSALAILTGVTNSLRGDLSYVPVLLYNAVKQGLANPSYTFQNDAEKIPRKIYPVYFKISSTRCKTCKYAIGRAWINNKMLRYGKNSWEFESLSGEIPMLLKVELEETNANKPLRVRTMFGRITNEFPNIISLELKLQE